MANSADLDGDGLLDLILSGQVSTGLLIYRGLPNGGLSAAGQYFDGRRCLDDPIVAADVNGDTLPDLLCFGDHGIDVFLNTGDGFAKPETLIAIPNIDQLDILSLAVGDLDRDGRNDVVEAHYLGSTLSFTVNAFLGLPGGGFSAAVPLLASSYDAPNGPDRPATLFLSDLNQDGFPDIGFASGMKLAVILRQADGGYQTTLYTGFPFQVASAPLPRQGRAPDLVVGHADEALLNGVLRILENDGTGHFSTGPTYVVPNFSQHILVSDLNGDCIPDVATSGPNNAEGIAVLYGDLDGGLAPPQSLPTYWTTNLTLLGPVSSPGALVGLSSGIVVYGNASRH